MLGCRRSRGPHKTRTSASLPARAWGRRFESLLATGLAARLRALGVRRGSLAPRHRELAERGCPRRCGRRQNARRATPARRPRRWRALRSAMARALAGRGARAKGLVRPPPAQAASAGAGLLTRSTEALRWGQDRRRAAGAKARLGSEQRAA